MDKVLDAFFIGGFTILMLVGGRFLALKVTIPLVEKYLKKKLSLGGAILITLVIIIFGGAALIDLFTGKFF